jgi:organic radical activating enzyme
MSSLVQATGANSSQRSGVAGGLRLPRVPEPVELEIELTNICNASCCVCPRSDMPESGILQAGTLERILDLYVELRERHSLNRMSDGAVYPRLTVAGGGEPMLHPRAIEMLGRMVSRGFPVHLITNASRISERRVEPLLATGITSIAVSFWGIVAEDYEQAMRLPFAPTLERVERLAEAARRAGVRLVVTWVATPQVRSTPAEVEEFWAARGIEVEVADNDAWNRGGLIQIGSPAGPAAAGRLPDPRRGVWCADLFFTDAWTWQGDCVLCCCNYFTSSRIVLGNIRTHDLRDIAAVKEEILHRRPLPSMCTVCEQPRQSQSTWLAEPWLPLLTPEERAMVTYDPSWQPPPGSVENQP